MNSILQRVLNNISSRICWIFIFSLFVSSPLLATPKSPAKTSKKNYRGWDFLVNKLKNDGINENLLNKVYTSKRMPHISDITFKLNPKESKAIYSAFTAKEKITRAVDFYRKHKASFVGAEGYFKVDSSVILAILLIETNFGTNIGNYLIVNRLSRVASIAEPENVQMNFKKLKKRDPKVTFEEVENRAKKLEHMFYPEVVALFEISHKHNIDIFSLKGSRAGAFGISQFLPSTFLMFGYDGDGNNHISLFDMPDAIWSIANFLSSFGWSDTLSREDKEKVVWKYNHSDAYVNAVLDVADAIEKVK